MSKRKTTWQKECIRCGKEFAATGKSCRVCEDCNTNATGAKNIRVNNNVRKELDNLIEDFQKPGMQLKYNNIIIAYLKMTKEFKLKGKLKKIILENKKS